MDFSSSESSLVSGTRMLSISSVTVDVACSWAWLCKRSRSSSSSVKRGSEGLATIDPPDDSGRDDEEPDDDEAGLDDEEPDDSGCVGLAKAPCALGCWSKRLARDEGLAGLSRTVSLCTH
jgi:hypothetical protein